MYKILIDYGSEGWKFNEGEYETLDSAVKVAIAFNSVFPFLIVKVINWEAKELG